jgi:hypothetical protein
MVHARVAMLLRESHYMPTTSVDHGTRYTYCEFALETDRKTCLAGQGDRRLKSSNEWPATPKRPRT